MCADPMTDNFQNWPQLTVPVIIVDESILGYHDETEPLSELVLKKFSTLFHGGIISTHEDLNCHLNENVGIAKQQCLPQI